MPKLLTLQQFLGMNTTKRKITPPYASEIQDLVSERGLTKTRPGFGKYNVTAQSGAILGIFDYRRKSGQKGYLFANANGEIINWQNSYFVPGFWNWSPINDYWTWGYESFELPDEEVWPWTVTGDDSLCSVTGKIFKFKGPGTLSYNLDPFLPTDVPLLEEEQGNWYTYRSVLEIRAKVITNEVVIRMGNGKYIADIRLLQDRVAGFGYNSVVPFDVYDEFHTYRLDMYAAIGYDVEYKMTIDDVYQTGGLSSGTGTSDTYLRIWPFTNAPTEILVSYIRYYIAGEI